MNFRCKFCNVKNKVGIYNEKMQCFAYYRDEKGMNHTGFICMECYTIHDCLISFTKLIPSLFKITHPYKIVKVETLIEWTEEIMIYKNSLGINCMEASVYGKMIPEYIITKLKDKNILGDCFNEDISITQTEFDRKKDEVIAKHILQNGDNLGLSL